MKTLKLQLLGISMILLGIALSTMNFFAIVGGVVGLVLAAAGYFLKDR